MSWKKELNTKFQELLDVFDKKYVEELFIEGMKIDAFPPNKSIQGIKYIHNNYVYTITRQRVSFPSTLREGLG